MSIHIVVIICLDANPFLLAQLIVFFGPGNGSPMAMNVVVVVLVFVGVLVIFSKY